MKALIFFLAISPAARAAALTSEQASRLAGLALKCASTEFPNKADHTANGPDDFARPRDAHPAFFGCYDWHSSVHGHWLMVRALKEHPDLPDAARLRAVLEAHLSTAAVAGEQACVGTHTSTAFGLAFALDYARAVDDRELEALLVERAKAYFGADKNYPASWEPGGTDFFSPALMEADLMRRVLPGPEFARWLTAFLPELANGGPKELLTPAIVADRSDPQIVHLDGLNLSRAWCLKGVVAALPADDPRRKILAEAAQRHLDASLAHVTSGDYAGEHWLASFALYALAAP